MRRHPTTAPLAALALTAALGGCNLHTPPTFTLDRIAIDESADDGQLRFILDGTNVNDDVLPLRDVTYTVAIDGQTPMTIRRSAQATLPAQDTQPITLPAPVSDVSAIDGRPYRLTGQVEYQLPGALSDLLFDVRIRRTKASFAFQGTIRDGQPAP